MIKFLHSKETIKALVTPQDFSTQSSLVRKTSIPVGVASIKFFLLSLLLIWSTSSLWSQVTVSYAYTGSNQTFTVPAGVTSISVKIWGAGGGGCGGPSSGGSGALVKGTISSLTTGQNLILVVGGGGANNTSGSVAGGRSE